MTRIGAWNGRVSLAMKRIRGNLPHRYLSETPSSNVLYHHRFHSVNNHNECKKLVNTTFHISNDVVGSRPNFIIDNSTSLTTSKLVPSSSNLQHTFKRGLPAQWRRFVHNQNMGQSEYQNHTSVNSQSLNIGGISSSSSWVYDETEIEFNNKNDVQIGKIENERFVYDSHPSNHSYYLREYAAIQEASLMATKAFICQQISRQYLHHQQQRYLSSSTDKPTPLDEKSSKVSPPDYDEHSAMSPHETHPESHAANPSADSAPTGSTNPSPSSASTSWSSVIQVPKYSQDADKAVRSLQKAQKERARAKTAANVRRALLGNVVICVSKLGAWMSSGSSSMMSEFVHSVVDCGNQALLLMGLRDSRNAADKRHPYGYGKSVYFWALVSALGTFFLGAGVSMSHAVQELWNPSLSHITPEVWAVLGFSFLVDGYVLSKTVAEIEDERPKGMSFLQYTSQIRDPATLAVLLEDGAACLGIIIAIAGISASHATGSPFFDGMAGVGISCLLGGIGLALVRVNHRFLIGQSVSRDMLDDIERIIKGRRSIDNVTGVQSQWTGPETFSFKAEVDFDGTYLAAHLMPRYKSEFDKAKGSLDQELDVLLSWYAEDVIRAVEREVRHIESMIRQRYPGAEYIELEPMSKHVDRFAIDDSVEEKLLLIEKETIQKFIRVVHQREKDKDPKLSPPKGEN